MEIKRGRNLNRMWELGSYRNEEDWLIWELARSKSAKTGAEQNRICEELERHCK